jgi:ankyrin repeat protein
LKAGADVDFKNNCRWISEKSYIDVVKSYIKALFINDDVNLQDKYGHTALMLVSQFGHIDIVKELLNNKADFNLQDIHRYRVLMKASTWSHTQIVTELLNKNDNSHLQNEDIYTALMMASENSILILLNKNANINLQNKWI